MIFCGAAGSDQFRCPTKWELWRQIMALLPRGRAWQTHEAGNERIIAAESSQAGIYELGSTGLGTEPVVERLTVLQQYWAAYAEVLAHMHGRACALIEEFYCSTVSETLPQWWVEYGFPDDCEPWTDLCAKVRAQGGATCGYLSDLAASRGWVLECSNCPPASSNSSAGCASAGCATPCGCPPNNIYLTIHLDQSPAYVDPPQPPASAGNARAGSALAAACPPRAEQLVCLIERFKPAHVRAFYIFAGA